MPDAADIDRFRTRLEDMLSVLKRGGGDLGRDDRSTVTLDQQSVGRLSRMDALQRQAMAQATERRRGTERRRIEAALARLNEGEYGYCADCGEDIPAERLEVDPTVPNCVTCAKG